MAFKGFNSILFDFSAIVDIKLSLIKYLIGEYPDNSNFRVQKFSSMDDSELKFRRVNGVSDIFQEFLSDQYLIENYEVFYESLIERDSDIIFTDKYAVVTSMALLVNAYRKAGEGTIKTAIRCSNKYERDYIKKILPEATIEYCTRQELNMGKYTRLVVGHWKHALEYRLEEPKSILVLNFRENFTDTDITMLRPELVISLGDIHSIDVVSAYRENDDIKPEG